MRTETKWPLSKATDLWQVGVIDAPIARVLTASDLTTLPIYWLPLPGSYRFLADPFAHRNTDGTLTVFVEAYDYRTKHGEIHYYTLDNQYQVKARGVALRTPTHLSYPYIIADADEVYMLPEAHRSGKLTLYRAQKLPDQWEPVPLLDLPAIDASPIHHNGTWWMFFALPGENNRALNELHIAHADGLMGPWQLHPANPVRTGLTSSRMGGTPFVHDGALYLPTQDCSTTYGGALTILKVEELTTTRFAATPIRSITATALHPDYQDGTHTLSACGDVTLIDVKHIDHSPMRRVIDLERRARRLLGAGA